MHAQCQTRTQLLTDDTANTHVKELNAAQRFLGHLIYNQFACRGQLVHLAVKHDGRWLVGLGQAVDGQRGRGDGVFHPVFDPGHDQLHRARATGVVDRHGRVATVAKESNGGVPRHLVTIVAHGLVGLERAVNARDPHLVVQRLANGLVRGTEARAVT